MFLKKSFDKLIENISLNTTRLDRIRTAHNSVRDFLITNDKIKDIVYDSYLQGSYRQGTAIIPMSGGEYDVDVVLTTNWKDDNGNFKDFLKLKNRIIEVIDSNENYKKMLKKNLGKRCITLDYQGDFHLDILPCHKDRDKDDIIWVRSKRDDWKLSNPKGFYEWINQRNKDSNNNLKPVIKLLKYWRDLQFSDNPTPKSIVLSTIVGECISDDDTALSMALVETMEQIVEKYIKSQDTVPNIVNPSLASENLSESWSSTDYNRFIKRFARATEMARKALDEEDLEKSIEKWNSSLLFYDNLPKNMENKKSIAEAIMIGEKLKESSLSISYEGKVDVPEERKVATATRTAFFGGE